MSSSRSQHYIFVHQVLPSLFFDDPGKVITLLAEHGENFLRFFWNSIGEHISPLDQVASDGLGYEIKQLDDDTLAALIILPPPQSMPEAYFVAAVYRPPRRENLLLEQETPARFITLEYGMNLDGSPRTVLCEWTANKTHTNMGNGPDPTPEAFFKEVCSLMAK